MDKLYTDITKKQAPPLEIKSSSLSGEILRKSLHSLIALVPVISAFNQGIALYLLLAGIVVYSVSEFFRIRGREFFLITNITDYASRARERDNVVLGPITLAIGAGLSLLLFPHPISSLAIYALAFGDSVAGLAGKYFSSFELPFTKGKTFLGSLGCFTMIYLCAFIMTQSMAAAFLIASVGTVVEALPIKEWDNIALPVSVGLVTYYLHLIP